MEGNYQPSPAVLARLATVHMVAVVGVSGAGKTTLINAALAHGPQVRQVLSTMTRTPRPGERDGVDCLFRSRDDVLAGVANGAFVSVVSNLNGGDIYATHPDSYTPGVVNLLPLFAQMVPEFRALPFASCRTVCILPASWDIWQTRLHGHGFSVEQQRRRMQEAVQSLEFAAHDDQTILLVNDDLRIAQAGFLRAVQLAPLPSPLRDTQPMAKQLARDLLLRLQKELKNTK